jgi:hypothetical protein
MPKTNGAGIQESWNRFEVTESLDPTSGRLEVRKKEGLALIASFVGGLITTMQNWSDNTQSRLPGYRDRIASVGLTGEEGGLNLDMPKDRIDALTERGGAVGAEFIRRFGFPAAEEKMNWDNHRWLRMRSCLASLESLLEAIDRSCANPQTDDKGYQIWIENLPMKSAPGYDWTATDQKTLALETLKELRKIMESIRQTDRSLADGAPRPRPELRPRAQV